MVLSSFANHWNFVRRIVSRCFTAVRGSSSTKVVHRTIEDDFLKRYSEVVVIGDVHGCYDELLALLDKIGNNNTILKLFVGDLVNKGPKSVEVIDFMLNNTDTCLSVLGNHDELAFKCSRDKALLDARPKLRWVENLTEKQIIYLESLPYTLSIPSLNCIIVHAGLVPNIALEEQDLPNLLMMRNLVDETSESQINKSRRYSATKIPTKGLPWAPLWTGPQHIYFGHDAARKYQKESNATGLDTGAVYGNELTALFIMGARKGTLVSVKAAKPYQPIDC